MKHSRLALLALILCAVFSVPRLIHSEPDTITTLQNTQQSNQTESDQTTIELKQHLELLKKAQELEQAELRDEALEQLEAAAIPAARSYENMPLSDAFFVGLDATKSNIIQMIAIGKIPAVLLGYFGVQHWMLNTAFPNTSIGDMCTKAGWFFVLKTASLLCQKQLMSVFSGPSAEMNFSACFFVATQAMPKLQDQLIRRIMAKAV